MEKEKKEIGKLIELLNEYEKRVRKSEYYEWEKGIGGDTNLFRRDTRDEEGSHLYSDTADTYVISKKYGFIKRLVESDKILETEVRPIQIYDYEGKYCDDEFGYSWFNQGLYYRVIMELAISDTPIEDLILYLK